MGSQDTINAEIRYAINLINFISDFINNDKSLYNEVLPILLNLKDNIQHKYIRKLVIDELGPFLKRLNALSENDQDSFVFNELNETIKLLNLKITLPEHFDNINSESYFNIKIKQLEKREKELRDILNSNESQTVEQKKITEETQEKLKKIEIELNKKKKELEIKQRQEDARNNWEDKITKTFDSLKDYLKPLKMEYNRLNILYYAFAFLTFFTLVIILVVEFKLINKLSSQNELPTLYEYIMILIPLPIAGALMWGFLYQMNRAQRQLIILSNNIHSINYIQGLLISINNLAPDINDGISRINSALDIIIANHLNRKLLSKESEIIEEENKDSIEIDKLLKVIKAVKGTTSI